MADTRSAPAEVTRDALNRARGAAAEVTPEFFTDISGSSSIFDDFEPADPEMQLTCWLDKASKLDDPKFYLTIRYD